MGVDRELLAEATETSHHVLDDAQPVVVALDVPGVRGRIGPGFHPELNLVGLARLDETSADEVIGAVVGRYAAEGKPFGWLVGPSSTPLDLPVRLQAAGLFRAVEFAGMAMDDLTRPLPPSPGVRVDQVDWDVLREQAGMMAESFGFDLTPQDASVWVDALAALQPRHWARGYLAFAEDGDTPAGFGLMCSTDVPGVVYLVAAGTLKAYRGRGVYRSLVARRLADARADGAEAAVIRAVRDTSAPICAQLGFTTLSTLDAYLWAPGGA